MRKLRQIPYIDLRDASPLVLLQRFPEQARQLIAVSTSVLGDASRLAAKAILPATDRISRLWLERAGNPYLPEITGFADFLKLDGVYTLNVCFEWGCTSGAFLTSKGVVLRRVLDWLFPRLGEFLVVAHQQGLAGDFLNITWPGLSGVYQAMAPGRFAAAINQAPMRRHGFTTPFDWLRNRVVTEKSTALPPAHLLRQVFETAPDYAAARKMLSETAIALPAIFILTGTGPAEGCVIERTETDAAIRELENDRVCVSNHFQSGLNDLAQGWTPRPIDSHGRAQAAMSVRHDEDEPFGWFVPPIANAHSRLVLNACADAGTLSVMGVEGEKPVTAIFVFPE